MPSIVRTTISALAVTALTTATAYAAEKPKVVVSIAPIHALVAGVMEGVGEPELLLKGGASPHSYSLRPSQARSLNEARVVVLVSDHLENFLERPVKALAGKADVVTLTEIKGMKLYEPREGGIWETHDHDHGHGHGDEKHDEHGHKEAHNEHGHKDDHDKHGHKEAHDEHGHKEAHDKHGHKEAHNEHGHKDDHDKHGHKDDHDKHGHKDAHDEHGHKDAHDEHAHEGADPHIWLDPQNAKRIASAVSMTLRKAYPDHAATFAANTQKLHRKLDQLDSDLVKKTKPLQGKPYIVFHDAYRYFDERYKLNPAGAITVSPERPTGARRLREIRQRISSQGVPCVFAEPQFQPKLVHSLISGTGAQSGTLDPLGADLKAGPDLYFKLMRNLATSLAACLKNPA